MLNIETRDVQNLTDNELQTLEAKMLASNLSQHQQSLLDAISDEMLFRAREREEIETNWEDDDEWSEGNALASAGWGTDEDYGSYGGDNW